METIKAPLLRLWYKYKLFVETNTRGTAENVREDITYWREKLFTNFIIYFWPISLMVFVPGVIIGIEHGYVFMSVFGIIAGILIFVIVFSNEINLLFRKAFVVSIIYCLAIVLLISLGSFGPGLIYLFGMSVFITLTFKRKAAYWSVALNFFICILCGLIIGFNLFNSPLIKQYNIGTWTAVSTNLIFLNLVSVILISNTIEGFETAIINKLRLQSELNIETVKRIRGGQLLKESEGHYKSLFFQNPSPMWVLDAENLKFLQVNDAALEKYGYTNEEFMLMTIEDIRHGKNNKTISDKIRENHKNDKPISSITSLHRKKNQEQFYVEVNFNTILFKGRKAILTIARDMTEQINYIDAIEKQNAKLQDIAYMQSHDVRAPLVRIMGLVDLMKKNNDEIPDRELLNYLDRSAHDLDEVIRKIHDRVG
jgi:PAS domain S-box-containing protein